MNLELILLIALALFFDISAFVAFFLTEDKKQKLVEALFFGGWLTSLALFAINWIEVGEPPFGNMYQVAIVISCCFYPFWKFLAVRHSQNRLIPFFAIAQAASMVGAFFMWKPEEWVRPPALQSIYFVPHVLSYMMGYALATVAFFIVFTAVLRSNLDKKLRVGIHLVTPTMLGLLAFAYHKSDSALKANISCIVVYFLFLVLSIVMRNKSLRLASVSQYDESAYRVLLLSYPFLTIGLSLGALWAEEAWGQYWSWDLKETWSLITWVLYAIFFHCRKALFFRKCSRPVHFLAYLALIITFLAVNLMPKLASSLHSYAN